VRGHHGAARDPGHPQRLGEPEQVRVARGRHQLEVEVAVGVVAVTAVAYARPLDLDQRAQPGDRLGIAHLGRQPGGARLDRNPGRPGMPQAGLVVSGHGRPPVGVKVDQALAGEPPQRLAQGGAADTELGGQLLLPQAPAGGQVAGEDPLAHRQVNLVDNALNLDPARRLHV